MVSPPANSYDFSFLSPCPIDGCIIQGNNDALVPEQSVSKLVEQIGIQSQVNIAYRIVNKADHFFTNRLSELGEIIDEYIISEFNNSSKGGKKDKNFDKDLEYVE